MIVMSDNVVLLTAFTILLIECTAGTLGESLDASEITDKVPSKVMDDIKKIKKPEDIPHIARWRDSCQTNFGEQALQDIDDATKDFMPCVTKQIRFSKLKIEVDKSMEKGELDLVFKKYCGRRDELMECVNNVIDKMDVCLNDTERQDINITRAAIIAGMDFTCNNDGDRIALFMGNKGQECLDEQKDNIRECFEESVPETKEVEQAGATSLNPEMFTINDKNCKNVLAFQKCVVKNTENCTDDTPSNILESLLTQMIKVTPCWEIFEEANLTGLSPGPPHTMMSHVLTLLTAALMAANIIL